MSRLHALLATVATVAVAIGITHLVTLLLGR